MSTLPLGQVGRVVGACVLLGLLAAGAGLWLGIGGSGLEAFDWRDPFSRQMLWELRAPRVLGAFLAGALLGVSGALAQAVFRNPLADPFLLGSASGASLAVAVALGGLGATPYALGAWPNWGLSAVSFAGALGAVCLTLLLARGVHAPLRLLLSGVVVGVVLGALTALWLTFHPGLQASMQVFNLGSAAYLGWPASGVMGSVLLATVCLACAMGRALDAMVLGDDSASSLGWPVVGVRRAVIALLALATGTAVAQVGLVAFVGLVSPHLVRACLRAGQRTTLPVVALVGGVLLMTADTLSRLIWPPQEVPVGVLTAVLGGGYLLWLMHRQHLQSDGGGR